jgi:hypothetical protein
MCCHLVCGKCSHAMIIPADQFFATPVLLLSPGQADPSPHQDYQPSRLPGDSLNHFQSETLLSVNIAICPSRSLPLAKDKYSSLPRKTGRRWSMTSARTGEKEKMEDCPLTVCTDCKQMVLQVGLGYNKVGVYMYIRTSTRIKVIIIQILKSRTSIIINYSGTG